MKISGSENTITVNIDEAKFLASQKPSWDGDTLNDKKIAVGKAIVDLMNTVNQENRNVAWGGSTEI